jgi:tetratricopeptide (TPR) repeat protein
VTKIASIIFIFLCSTLNGWAQTKFDFNASCFQAYQEIGKLKTKTGQLQIQQLHLQQPDNLVPVLLKNYIDFYTLFFNEDPAEYTTLFPQFQERLTLIEKGNKSSPFYLYSQAVIRIQRATVQIKFGNFWDAGWDCRKAFILLKENKKKFPQFSPNDLWFGALEAVIGTVPKGYKWLTSLFGMRGSIAQGMKKVRNFTYSNDPWAKLLFNESAFVYTYLLFYLENDKEAALTFINQKKLDLENNHLHAFMAANLALNNKEVELSKNIIFNRNKSDEYLPLPIWDFLMGYAKMYHLETPEAIYYFEQYTKKFKGKFYVKDVYQKISWCYFLQGNMQQANANKQLAIVKGATYSDADKKALKDAKEKNWPNTTLLKARLLSDGGYHLEALKQLAGKSLNNFSNAEESLEFVYRVARIYDDLDRKEDAIKNYLNTIKLGENRKEYYAARAAFQIGQIYENKGEKALAIQYYQKCISMEDHEYKDSLDQRAKSGIARCSGN